MVMKKNQFVNPAALAKRSIKIILFSVASLAGNHSAVITFVPFPKEVYAEVSAEKAPVGAPSAKKMDPQQALNGNIIIHNGYYYIGSERIVVDLQGDPETIKFVITDRLKTLPFKSPVKGVKDLSLGSTNKGIALDQGPRDPVKEPPAAEEIKDKAPEPAQSPQAQLLAKCFILTKKNQATQNFSWDRKIIEIFENQPLPSEFTASFLIPDKISNGKSYTNAVFQNEVIFFMENPSSADMDIERPVPIPSDQKPTEDAVLPSVFVRTDIPRTSPLNIIESLPFLQKMRQDSRADKKVERSMSKDSASVVTQVNQDAPTSEAPAKK